MPGKRFVRLHQSVHFSRRNGKRSDAFERKQWMTAFGFKTWGKGKPGIGSSLLSHDGSLILRSNGRTHVALNEYGRSASVGY